MPNRIIKESIRTSETVSSLSDFEFRLWVSLIVSADDVGRGDARPAIIKGQAFPLRDRVTVKDIDGALHGLAAKGCVSLYKVGGKPYFWFPTWAAHQRVRDCKPKFPSPEDADDPDIPPQFAATCGELPPESNTNPNTNPNPKEKARAHKYGEYRNVLLTDEELDKLKAEFSDWQHRIERLSAYMASTGKAYKNHLATIRNWAKRDAEKTPAAPKKETSYDMEDIKARFEMGKVI